MSDNNNTGSSTLLDDDNGIYMPGMAPLAATPEVQSNEQSGDTAVAGDGMTLSQLKKAGKDSLEAIALERGVDISAATNNDMRADLIFADIEAKATDEESKPNESTSTATPEVQSNEQSGDTAVAGDGKAVVLVRGATYTKGSQIFLKGVPVNVGEDLAGRLISTGMFEAG